MEGCPNPNKFVGGILTSTNHHLPKLLFFFKWRDDDAMGYGLYHYKKSVFLVMFKKRVKRSKKTGMMSMKTSPKIGSTETCKNMGKIALNMDNVYLDVPVLTSPCLIVVIPVFGS